jgi:hypothetical protein
MLAAGQSAGAALPAFRSEFFQDADFRGFVP